VAHFFESYRRRLTALLTVWMTVVGFGVSVSHAHADGTHQHVHGCGWNVSSTDIVPISGSNGSGEIHTHWILLGVEFPNQSTPDSVPTIVCEIVTALEFTCSSMIWDIIAAASVEFSIANTCLIIARDGSAKAEPCRIDPSVTLSSFARRAVTGVLRS